VTNFLNEHPGGADTLLGVAGKDAHSAFMDAGHSSSAHKMAEKYLVGPLEGGGADGKSESCTIC
jgi:cytochrome-b5 reductase